MELDFAPLVWVGAALAFVPAFALGVFVGAKFF